MRPPLNAEAVSVTGRSEAGSVIFFYGGFKLL